MHVDLPEIDAPQRHIQRGKAGDMGNHDLARELGDGRSHHEQQAAERAAQAGRLRELARSAARS